MDLMMDALPGTDRVREFFPVGNDSPKVLTQEQIRKFNTDGYVFPLDIFSPTEIAAQRDYFATLMKMAEETGQNSYSINGWHNTTGT